MALDICPRHIPQQRCIFQTTPLAPRDKPKPCVGTSRRRVRKLVMGPLKGAQNGLEPSFVCSPWFPMRVFACCANCHTFYSKSFFPVNAHFFLASLLGGICGPGIFGTGAIGRHVVPNGGLKISWAPGRPRISTGRGPKSAKKRHPQTCQKTQNLKKLEIKKHVANH